MRSVLLVAAGAAAAASAPLVFRQPFDVWPIARADKPRNDDGAGAAPPTQAPTDRASDARARNHVARADQIAG